MKRILLFLLLTQLNNSFAQSYGNEWINYNQNYYRFEVINSGLHRIDHDALVNAGIPVSSFNSSNIQLFGREQEVPVFINDGGDNVLDPGDYILFYANGNDGWIDSLLYLDPATIANPAYSLYNDTINYFFTWNSSTTNLRYQLESDVNFSAYSSISPYINFLVAQNHNNQYQDGVKNSLVSGTFYTAGKGWSASRVNGVGNHTSNLSLSTPNPYTGPGAPSAFFQGLSVSASDASFTGTGNHHLQWTIGSSQTILLDTIFTGYKHINCSESISSTLLSNGTTPIQWKIIDDQDAATDFQAYSYYSIRYPRLPNFGNATSFSFSIPNDPQGKIRLDASNVGGGTRMLFVTGDIPRLIPFEDNGGVISALIPNSTNGVEQNIHFQTLETAIPITTLTPVNGSGTFVNYMNHPNGLDDLLIFIHHETLSAAATNYAAYRESVPGGSYNVLNANVEDLYWQFGGGVEKHIIAIRRFSKYLYDNSTLKPLGLFILGKGIREADYNSLTSDGPGTRKSPTRFAQSLIPSFGHPSSDVAITSGMISGHSWVPLMPTGRISARTNSELQDYLNKVIAFEAQQNPFDIYDSPNKDWQKQVIHFAGGSDIGQQNQFQSYMNNMATKIEGDLFGGNVTNVFNTSSDPLNPAALNDVTDRIAEGVSLMSYFGHASPTNSGFEINLDEPANWGNYGKYPLMLVNSCYNGNIFQLGNSKSEDFVQIADLGAIGYIASVAVGVDVYLNIYSQKFYEYLSKLSYGANLGTLMKNTIEQLEVQSGLNNLYMESTCTQMVLNGDPMLHLNPHERPEIELLPEYVTFSPSEFDLSVDSITVSVNLKNLGRSVTDTFTLELTRSFPGGMIDSVYTKQVAGLDYTKLIEFKMPLQANIGVGINQITVRADLPSFIQEQYDEVGNNQITKNLIIDIDGIVPVIPYEFAVVPLDSVTVKASTINPIADFNTYRFEIDTTDLFNSPEHRFAIISGLGGVKEVHPSQWLSAGSGMSDPLVCEDSMVYFWRVAVDSTVHQWRESSFQYITGKEGWGQDHFFQFKKNAFNAIDYDRPTRTRQFGPFTKTIECFNKTYFNPFIRYDIDGQMQEYSMCIMGPAIHVVVIDPLTLTPWETFCNGQNPQNSFGNLNDNCTCRPRPEKYFIFRQNTLDQLQAFQNMIENEVPDGHYLLIYTPMTTVFNDWDALLPSVYDVFADLGSTEIQTGHVNEPFIFFCKKGDPTSVEELFSNGLTDFDLSADLIGADYIGIETSTLIGPASNWGNVYWKQDPIATDVTPNDSTVLRIRAYDITGALQQTIDTLFTANDSILNLNTVINAQSMPYLRLEAYYVDSISNTPSQIDRWHVLYDPLPEAAIDGTTAYTWSLTSDTVDVGQTIDFAVDIKNIFTVDMDSLLVSYWIEDANQIMHPVNYPRQDSLRVGETLRDTVTIPTAGLSGLNSLWVEVNPYVNGSLYITDQPEQQHFNNILQVPFYVRPDDRNPILDVTFDGQHILNGDIVNPYSEVLITLKDDNEFLIMDNVADTALFGVYLTDPSGVQRKISFTDGVGNTIMQWIPAEPQHKRFKIIWPTDFKMNGKYTLFVQGTDKSGNLSGDLEYRVSFEVIHESTITHMMNYPNPFSTSTRFVFTLTGSEVPEDIIIQIMTVSGRVVREITEDQLGTIRIGRNITEYAWDGRDEFGDPLANGVYLYQVKARINGEDIEHRESGADEYFKKNFGKMYLMR
jgi:hypothetical protein